MMKNFTSLLFLLAAIPIFSQVGVNTVTPNAMLDVDSPSSGLLVPRIALTAANAAAPVTNPQGGGLITSTLIYNTATVGGVNGVAPGFYYWNGVRWIAFSGRNWTLAGNAGVVNPAVPATYGTSTFAAADEFLGTTDANDVTFGTNNIERMRIKQTTGNVGIGTAAPATKLDVRAGNALGFQLLSGNNAQYAYLSIGRANEYAQIGAATDATFFTDALAGDMAIKNFNTGTSKILLGSSFFAPSAMSIGSNGNIGVNTYTANSKLDVRGDIALREGTAITVANGTNALNPATEFSHYRLTGATAPFSVNTIANGNDGQIITLINNTTQLMTIANNNAANGILTGTGASIVSSGTATSSATLMYNASFARWVLVSSNAMVNADDWHLTGNAGINNPAVPATYGASGIGTTENWIGTTNAADVVLGTNTIERLRVKQSTGFVGIGTAAPSYRLHVATPTTGAIALYANNSSVGNSDGRGVYGRSVNNPGYGYGGYFEGGYIGGYFSTPATTYAGIAYGVSSTVSGAAGARVAGYFSATGPLNSTGVQAYANSIIPNLGWFSLGSTVATANDGKGIETGGENIGIEARANATNSNTIDKMPGLFYVSAAGFPAIAAVGAIIDNVTYKIFGFGVVSTIVRDTEGKNRIMVAPEAPEALFQDYGSGNLVNGMAEISLDPILAKNIRVDANHPLKVFIQLEGDCKGVFVYDKTQSGFKVKELQGGTSSVAFTYQIIGVRADEERGGHLSKYSEMRFKPMTKELRPVPKSDAPLRPTEIAEKTN